jgi:hypothetical protein
MGEWKKKVSGPHETALAAGSDVDHFVSNSFYVDVIDGGGGRETSPRTRRAWFRTVRWEFQIGPSLRIPPGPIPTAFHRRDLQLPWQPMDGPGGRNSQGGVGRGRDRLWLPTTTQRTLSGKTASLVGDEREDAARAAPTS